MGFWNFGIVGMFEVFLAFQMGIWIFVPNFFEENEVETSWESAVEVPNMPIRYFEEMTAFYFESEKFDPAN